MNPTPDQVKLKKWIEEYTLYQTLEGELSELSEYSPAIDFSEEQVPAEGQIRLWPAVHLEYPPMYGLLMRAGYGRWRVLPFSPLGEPAIPTELKISDAAPARVVQGWNARELPHSKVKQSWFVDTLSEVDIFKLNRWWLMLAAGEEIIGDVEADVGPCLRHPLDPRHGYLDSETERADLSLGASVSERGESFRLQKAAEPETDYDSKNKNDPR